MSGALLFMLLDQPFAGTIQLQTRAVDNRTLNVPVRGATIHFLSAIANRS